MDKRLAPAAIEWLQQPIHEPRDFVRAAWRGTTAVNPKTGNEIGFSLNTLNGTQRFVLSLHDARQLAESLLEYLAQAGGHK